MALAMFFPTIAAIVCCIIFEKETQNWKEFIATTIYADFKTMLWSFFASIIAAVLVIGALCMSMLFKWAKPNPDYDMNQSAVHSHNKNQISGFLRAAGEVILFLFFFFYAISQS